MIIAIFITSIFSLFISVFILLKVVNFSFLKRIKEITDEIEEKIEKNFRISREENQNISRSNREEINNSFKNFNESISQNFMNLAKIQREKIDEFSKNLQSFEEKIFKNIIENRQELSKNLQEFDKNQKQKFDEFFQKNEKMRIEIEQKLDFIRQTVENKLQFLQEENNKKLEQMRITVDEKLQETVEKRFNQSFKLVSENLDKVNKSMAEMQNLAIGVGDLKKVLSNVKTRGNIGEIQLKAILEQFLSPAQYVENAVVKENSKERVEFAIKIPSKDNDDEFLFLPIDSKFPIEDFQRLNDAYQNFDQVNQQQTKSAIDFARKQFENSVKKAAKDIFEKYLNPPKTTDFAIMFVPTEGLYAEILKNSLFEEIQKNYRVVILGPSNIVAFLNALQMGFKTLTIQKKSSDIWQVLNLTKQEFAKFGVLLDKAKKKIQEAGNTLGEVETGKRAVERKLRNVEGLSEIEFDETSIYKNDELL